VPIAGTIKGTIDALRGVAPTQVIVTEVVHKDYPPIE